MFITDSPIMWQIHTEVGSINNMKKITDKKKTDNCFYPNQSQVKLFKRVND